MFIIKEQIKIKYLNEVNHNLGCHFGSGNSSNEWIIFRFGEFSIIQLELSLHWEINVIIQE